MSAYEQMMQQREREMQAFAQQRPPQPNFNPQQPMQMSHEQRQALARQQWQNEVTALERKLARLREEGPPVLVNESQPQFNGKDNQDQFKQRMEMMARERQQWDAQQAAYLKSMQRR